MKILVLNKDDIEKVFTMREAIESCKEALKLYSDNKTIVPLRINIDVKEENASSLYMPGYVHDSNSLGLKIVSVFPNNIDKKLPVVVGAIVLLNSNTGEMISLLDGTHITKLRTGAVAGAATDLLARANSKIFAMIGCGGQAERQLEAVLNVRNIELVKIYSRSADKARDFASVMNEKFGEKYRVKIIRVESSDKAIEDADIITTITTSNKPVLDGRKVRKGTHINGMGSYTPDMQELDECVITKENKVYVDTKDGVLNEAGDFISPIKNGSYKKEYVNGELGDIVLGGMKGRESDDEITVFKSTGTAVLDMVVSSKIYEVAINKKIGQYIEL